MSESPSPQAERHPNMLAELRMYELSWALRSKPDWQRKASNPNIFAKWQREALEQEEDLKLDQQMTEDGVVDYVLAELAGYAKIADITNEALRSEMPLEAVTTQSGTQID
ncbi:hypothetical protein B0H13DRAFT_1859919 [Mycena leptocephala]|nr:hypothetical protein B0H13DRAFT_1859919 [Mycena leptocephala]